MVQCPTSHPQHARAQREDPLCSIDCTRWETSSMLQQSHWVGKILHTPAPTSAYLIPRMFRIQQSDDEQSTHCLKRWSTGSFQTETWCYRKLTTLHVPVNSTMQTFKSYLSNVCFLACHSYKSFINLESMGHLFCWNFFTRYLVVAIILICIVFVILHITFLFLLDVSNVCHLTCHDCKTS